MIGDRVPLLCAIGAILMSGVAVSGQTAATPLPDALRVHVQGERFDLVTSIRGLPLGVRAELQTLFASRNYDIAQDIAQPGARFQGTGATVDAGLPLRRLISAECSIDHCLVYYERGGTVHTWHVVLLHWTPEATRVEWGGTTARALATIADVRNAVLSGTVNGPARFW